MANYKDRDYFDLQFSTLNSAILELKESISGNAGLTKRINTLEAFRLRVLWTATVATVILAIFGVYIRATIETIFRHVFVQAGGR